MSEIRFVSSIIALGVLVCSCASNRVDTGLRGAVVRIEPDSVPLERTSDVTRLAATVIIRNDRSTPLYLVGCGPEVQQEMKGQWQTVWSPVCVNAIGGLIAPGDSAVYPLNVGRYAKLNVYPQLDPRATTGRYRLLYGATYSEPLNYGEVRSGPEPPPVTLSDLTSPIFIVYSP